jgi:hypothetical protein
VKLLGFAQVPGAAGVVAPWATGTMPVLTLVAAFCLLVLMLGAVKTKSSVMDAPSPSAFLRAIASAIAMRPPEPVIGLAR